MDRKAQSKSLWKGPSPWHFSALPLSGAAWVGFSTESLGMRERYLPSTEFPGSPKGRQIWKTGTAPAQMAASSWLWQGEVLTLCCWLPGPSQPSKAGLAIGKRACESPTLPAAHHHPDLATLALAPRWGAAGGAGPATQPAALASLFLPQLLAWHHGVSCRWGYGRRDKG